MIVQESFHQIHLRMTTAGPHESLIVDNESHQFLLHGVLGGASIVATRSVQGFQTQLVVLFVVFPGLGLATMPFADAKKLSRIDPHRRIMRAGVDA